MSDTQDTLIERLGPDAVVVWFGTQGAEWRYLNNRLASEMGTATHYVPATALADRDAKIADEIWNRDFARKCANELLTQTKALEAQVAELTQKLERATALVAKFVRCNDEGPGLIDCIDNDGERYTSQFLSDTVREARALNSGASQNG